MLAWALAQHSELSTSLETDFLFHLYGEGHLGAAMEAIDGRADGGWLLSQGVHRDEFLEALSVGLNALITSRSEGRRWVDQSPTYTLIAPDLSQLFPEAQFLHIVRDGRGVVHSMISSGFSAAWASDFEVACTTWSDFVRAGRSFEIAASERCLVVKYADLVGDPEGGFADILRFLNLPLQAGPATFVRTTRINSSYQPDGPASGYRGPSDPWRLWTDEQRQIFARVAGATLVAEGFATEQDLGAAA